MSPDNPLTGFVVAFVAAAALLPLEVAARVGEARSSATLASAVTSTAAPEVKTGGTRLVPIDGSYRVWTRRVGKGPIKLLTLHGGPGSTHEYFECFEDFLPQHGVELIYYDQLGSEYSDQPDDPSLFTIQRYREEVEQVRKALGLEDFYLLGHSWGGMLAIEYALKYQGHLKGLILSNVTASVSSSMTYVGELRKQLPAEDQRTLAEYEALGDFSAPEYDAVMSREMYAKHLLRLTPLPDPVVRSLKHMNAAVFNTMDGPNEFAVTGNLKGWDRWGDLHSIAVPTELMVGKFDEVRPADVEKMGTLIAGSRVAVLDKGSHFSMYDDQDAYFRELVRFLEDVEAGKLKKAAR